MKRAPGGLIENIKGELLFSFHSVFDTGLLKLKRSQSHKPTDASGRPPETPG